MDIKSICARRVAMAMPGDTVVELAERMRECHVGDLVVVEQRQGASVPVGIVTDRDIVLAVVARRLAPATVTAADIMSANPQLAHDTDTVLETAMTMRKLSIRRMPVVDADGDLFGIVTLDDLLQVVAVELAALATIANSQRRSEAQADE